MKVFTFGSNEQGIHKRGAALFALQKRGAILYQGVGHQGNSYAIPTKKTPWISLPLSMIQSYVNQFIAYAKENPQLEFQVTRIGCGLAGYTDAEIAPMFVGVPGNCELPVEWEIFLMTTPPPVAK